MQCFYNFHAFYPRGIVTVKCFIVRSEQLHDRVKFLLVRSINATLHKRVKDLVPKRYRFTLQSTLFEEKDQDIGQVITEASHPDCLT